MICMFDVLEHLTDQKRIMEEIGKRTDIVYILNPEPCQSKYHTNEFTVIELIKFMFDWKYNYIKHFKNADFFEFYK